jgi:hypothetical protein
MPLPNIKQQTEFVLEQYELNIKQRGKGRDYITARKEAIIRKIMALPMAEFNLDYHNISTANSEEVGLMSTAKDLRIVHQNYTLSSHYIWDFDVDAWTIHRLFAMYLKDTTDTRQLIENSEVLKRREVFDKDYSERAAKVRDDKFVVYNPVIRGYIQYTYDGIKTLEKIKNTAIKHIKMIADYLIGLEEYKEAKKIGYDIRDEVLPPAQELSDKLSYYRTSDNKIVETLAPKAKSRRSYIPRYNATNFILGERSHHYKLDSLVFKFQRVEYSLEETYNLPTVSLDLTPLLYFRPVFDPFHDAYYTWPVGIKGLNFKMTWVRNMYTPLFNRLQDDILGKRQNYYYITKEMYLRALTAIKADLGNDWLPVCPEEYAVDPDDVAQPYEVIKNDIAADLELAVLLDEQRDAIDVITDYIASRDRFLIPELEEDPDVLHNELFEDLSLNSPKRPGWYHKVTRTYILEFDKYTPGEDGW